MTIHDAYFAQLQAALLEEGELRPRLIVDLDRLDHNIDQAVAFAARAGKALRLVEKSLPSFELLDYIARRAGTRRLMSFHQPFLTLDAQHWPDADILLGKPMPVALVLLPNMALIPSPNITPLALYGQAHRLDLDPTPLIW